MSELKTDLLKIRDMLKELEDRARKLKNQNLADIAASAHGRVKQLLDHPDTDLVADEDKVSEVDLKPPYDPNAPLRPDAAALDDLPPAPPFPQQQP